MNAHLHEERLQTRMRIEWKYIIVKHVSSSTIKKSTKPTKETQTSTINTFKPEGHYNNI
jgi:hypothetical protein